MNNQNLKPFTKENAKEFGSKGGKASAKSKAELNTIKKQLKFASQFIPSEPNA